MQDNITTPACKRCGGKTGLRGFETFAVAPHKRRRYTCKTCGHSFVPKEEGVIQNVNEASN